MESIINLMLGSASIIFGCYAIRSTYRNPGKTLWSADSKGYAAGFVFILLGLIYILRKLHIVNW